LLAAADTLQKLKPSDKNTVDAASLREKCYEAMNDDFNSPIVIAHLFETVRIINCINDGKESIDAENLESLKATFNTFVFDILGFKSEADASAADDHTTDGLMNLVLDLRQNAKNNKDWAAADKIRDSLKVLNIEVKDTKEGVVWSRL
jgi:cysteinyl-tRNA synthetase